LHNLLVSNSEWVEGVLRFQPHFFENSAKGQTPHTLWIGCSDSRVPESVITLARPGDIFVHRNIANQVHLNDSNGLSVLEYAVDHVGVENVIVVGHSECGGAHASLVAAQSNPSPPPNKPIITIPSAPADAPLNLWLEPLTRLAISLNLSSVPESIALPVVVEENVKDQVFKLTQTQTIIDAWTKGTPKGQSVWIHGWVYELDTGYLRDLNISQGPPG
ncbi:hypothetical protein HYPSUDRAFT_110621, partial [Hypholoma sublateritium FD-334 SS-4]